MNTAKTHRFSYITAVSLIIIAAILYCSWPLGFWLNPVASRTGLASELGALHQPYNWLFIWADIISGIFIVCGVGMLTWLQKPVGWRRAGFICLAVYGFCGAIDAALPLRCLPSIQTCGSVWRDPVMILHGIVDFSGSIALIGTFIAGWLHVRDQQRSWLPWIYIIGGGGIVFAGLSLLFIIINGPGYWAQRYYITLSCIWVVSSPFVFGRESHATIEKLTN